MNFGTREKVAIKIIKKGKCSDMSKLDREIQSVMGAKHEYIVALKKVLYSENILFIFMELCGAGYPCTGKIPGSTERVARITRTSLLHRDL